MIKWALQVLNKINAGIAVIDINQKIVFWNEAISKISELQKKAVVGKSLCEICPKFNEKRYQDMLISIFEAGQSRFCSSAIHKAFIYPPISANPELLRQNLQIDPITLDNKISYTMIQITDVTEDVHNQSKYHKIIENLKKGIKEIEIAAEKKANYDTLTGVLNRQGLEVELQKYIDSKRHDECRYVVFFLDMDGFKNVNDTYGHVVGDALLQQVAGRLKSHIRQNDDRQKDILSRIGGDEFVVAFFDISGMDDIVAIADKIVNTVRKPFFIDNNKIQVSLSLGIATFPENGMDYHMIIQKADEAMYRIKQSGKNRFGFYDAQMQKMLESNYNYQSSILTNHNQ